MSQPPRRIGLLFVHGVGEQQPFEHLRASVSQLAELLRRDGYASCAVVDRTEGLAFSAQAPTALGEAPITLIVKDAGGVSELACHEVYWADTGWSAWSARSSAFAPLPRRPCSIAIAARSRKNRKGAGAACTHRNGPRTGRFVAHRL